MIRRSTILEVACRHLYWPIIVVSVVVYFRGHDLPGGGFIGGLLAVCASILWGVTFGSAAAIRRLPLGDPMILAGFGVLLSGLAGLPSLVFGLPYMTHLWGEFPLPLTNLKVSTVMVFDFGIYCSVWGSLGGYSLTLLQLDEQEESRS